jgi:Cu-Zn family superoxide dismutase
MNKSMIRSAMVVMAVGAMALMSSALVAQDKPATPDAKAVAVLKPSKAATTRPTMNNVSGTVTFTQYGDEVEVVAEVTGLTPNSEHGFHIHDKGDLSDPGLMSTGGHWDPSGHKHHGAPDSDMKHAGDLGNLKADESGTAKLTVRTKAFSLTKDPNAVGHAVIVHAGMDDMKSQPAGNAGARVAGGVIEKQ